MVPGFDHALILGNRVSVFLFDRKTQILGVKMKRQTMVKGFLVAALVVLFAGSALAKTVTLHWDASPSAVSGYKIYYQAGSSQAPLTGSGATEGASPVDVGNVLTYTLTGLADSETHFFAVTAYDSNGNESSYSNIVESPPVSAVNNAPVLNPIGTKTIGEGSQLSFTISGSDPDNDALTYSASNLPAGAIFSSATRSFVWIPDFDSGTNTRVYAVTFQVSDGSLTDEETVTINVTHVNRSPVLASIGTQNLTEGDSLNLVVSATDPDGDAIFYSASNLPSGAVFTPSTRSLSWIPDTTQGGSYSVTISASDGSLSAAETFTINVATANQAPVLATIGNQTVSENTLLSFVVNASDPENDSLSFSAANLPSGASFDTLQHSFSWTPDFTQAGNFTVTFSVSDGSLSDSETVAITVTNTNQPPTIGGTPATSVMANTEYSFTPTASDLDGDNLSFNINNLPSWASFDPATGHVSGTPSDQQVGTSGAITIGVTDGTDSAVLPAFTITVTAFVAQDTDGDGVLDNLDAFPNDPSEWLDTDGDGIGNNADTDDDNDGIADVRDGFPLDPGKSGWIITATAGTGGYITPEGETSVLYGGSQNYTLTAKAGYYVSALLVDNVSVGMTDSYQFTNVTAHHNILAAFASIPNGLSLSPVEPGLPGVARVDNGDDHGNLVEGKPKLDLDFRFQVNLRDTAPASQRKVFLMLDGYRYEMQLDSGALATGATYTYLTRLGPAFSHNFYFQAEDLSGNVVSRYPQGNTLTGPTIELLDGKNVIGVAANVNSAGLDSKTAFNVTQAYRWIPADKLNGSYEQIDRGPTVMAGEGYVLKRTTDSTLPQFGSYGEISASSYEIQVKPGWNLIANPYKGNVALADVQVKLGTAPAVPWLTAADNNLLVDGIYYYLGKDWGNSNAFASAAGPNAAVLTPWIGYWIYLNPTTEPISLLISKPQQ